MQSYRVFNFVKDIVDDLKFYIIEVEWLNHWTNENTIIVVLSTKILLYLICGRLQN